MAQPYLLTYQDLIEHTIDFTGAVGEAATERDVRSAVQSAYRDIAQVRGWKYYYTQGRIMTQASYSTGTVSYDHTGGSNERQLTLTSGTWPSWAASGRVLINDITSSVATRVSSTVVTLDAVLNPGEDIASGTSYVLFQDTYTLPNDFRALDEVYSEDKTVLAYVPPRDWLNITSRQPSAGPPLAYTIMSDPDLYGSMAMFFDRYPTSTTIYDYIYQRDARKLRYSGFDTNDRVGTISGSAGSQSVTGSGTAFAAAHVGSVIRFSDTSTIPTGLSGTNPYQEQRIIASYTSATSITLDAVLSGTYSADAYTISDPVDIDTILIEALLRSCERQMAIKRRMKNLPEVEAMYRQAIRRAMESDSRVFTPRSPGGRGTGYDRLLTPSLGADQGD